MFAPLMICAVVLAGDVAAAAGVPHPLLIPTHARLDIAYEAGAKERKMGDDERVVALFRQDLGRVRGPSNWKPSQAQFRCSLVDAFLQGYEDGTIMAAKGLARDSDILKDFTGEYGSQVEFVVDVRAFPAFNGIDSNIARPAEVAEVEKVELALKTFDGRSIKPVSKPSRGPTETAVVAGESVYGELPALYFLPHWPDPRELGFQYEAFQVQYRVWFPVRDADGKPMATLEHPDITLVMTRPSGDLSAKFDLGSIYQSAAGK